MSDTLQSVNIALDVSTASGQAWQQNGYRTSWYPTPYVDYGTGIQERADVRYASLHPFGRTEAYKTFVGVNNREVTLRFHYVAGEGKVTGSFYAPNNSVVIGAPQTIGDTVIKPALWLENLKYPISAASPSVNSYYPPPPVFLVIGTLLSMRAIVTECRINWNGPWHTVSTAISDQATPNYGGLSGNFGAPQISPGSDLLPHVAEVTVTFTSVSRNPTGTLNPESAFASGRFSRPGLDYAN